MQHILSLLRRAVDDYSMIDDGDKVVVGCSGGKDSTLLLYALDLLSKFYPRKFSVVGVAIDMGLGMDYTPLETFCKEHDIELIIKKTEIYKIIFEARKESNPCSLCSRMRRGALNKTADEIGAKKVALGHHRDDVTETFFLNLIHEGRLGTFQPVTYLSRTGLTVIRPMIYIPEKDVKNTVKRLEIPVLHNPCPADGETERAAMKQLVSDLDYKYRGVKELVFGAIERSNLDGWEKNPVDYDKE